MRQRLEINYLKIIKIAAGAMCSAALAEALGLTYATSAGIITLLSIQDTKKETIRVVVKRLIAFGAALFFFALITRLIGFNVIALGAFLLVFSPVCMAFGLAEGISPNAVLMCHFLAAGEMTLPLIGEEFLLLLIGTGFGVAMNLYMPRRTEQIRGMQRRIEDGMRRALLKMAGQLDGSGGIRAEESGLKETGSGAVQPLLTELRQLLDSGAKHAYENMENHLLEDVRYYLRYMNLRRTQLLVLERTEEHLSRLEEMRASYPLPAHAAQIADFMRHISESFHEYNNAEELLKELDERKAVIRRDPLPQNREEFERRAVLFQVMVELEQFLTLKAEFVRRLPKSDIETFWNVSGSGR